MSEPGLTTDNSMAGVKSIFSSFARRSIQSYPLEKCPLKYGGLGGNTGIGIYTPDDTKNSRAAVVVLKKFPVSTRLSLKA